MIEAKAAGAHLTIEDSGWFEATVKAADGTTTDIRLDTLRAHNTYAAICVQHADDEMARADAWGRYLMDNAVPPLSQAAAWRIAEALIERVRVWYPLDEPAPPPA